jgi:SM-20-related protein
MLNFAALRDAQLKSDPFDYVVVPDFIDPAMISPINDNFPNISQPGSFPVSSVPGGAMFRQLAAALQGADMTEAVSEKFGIDLTERPTMLTVRGQCRKKDGQIHCDSDGKILTALLYLNGEWQGDAGQLRLLRSPDDIEDYAAAVPPKAGTLLIFRCTDNAWHGHKPYEGQRRSLQLNWVVGRRYLWKENIRHSLSAMVKKMRQA